MFIDPAVNEESLEIESIDLDWVRVMKILNSHNLVIDRSIINEAQRKIKKPYDKPKILSRAIKRLGVNGGRGVFGFRDKRTKTLLGLEYAKLNHINPVLIITTFRQIEDWVKTINEVNDDVKSVNVFLGIDPNSRYSNVSYSKSFVPGFDFYICDINAFHREDYYYILDKVEFTIIENFLNSTKRLDILCREFYPILFTDDVSFSKHDHYNSTDAFEKHICWNADQRLVIKEIHDNYYSIGKNPEERKKIISYLLRKVRLTV